MFSETSAEDDMSLGSIEEQQVAIDSFITNLSAVTISLSLRLSLLSTRIIILVTSAISHTENRAILVDMLQGSIIVNLKMYAMRKLQMVTFWYTTPRILTPPKIGTHWLLLPQLKHHT